MALFRLKKKTSASPPDMEGLTQKRDIPGLITALGNEKAAVRQEARNGLSALDDAAVVDALKQVVGDENEPATRRDAAKDVLTWIGSPPEAKEAISQYESELKRRPAPSDQAAVASDPDASSWYCTNCQKWVTRGEAAYNLSAATPDWRVPVDCFTCGNQIALTSR